MNQTVRANVNPPYSLHDMNVIAFEVEEDTITMRTQSGMIKTEGLSSQVDGYVIFKNVQWDFSYVYLLDFTGYLSINRTVKECSIEIYHEGDMIYVEKNE